MNQPRNEPRIYLDHFPAITIQDLRIAKRLSRKRFNADTDSFTVTFDDGRKMTVKLIKKPMLKGNFRKYMKCPTCGRAVTTLRVSPQGLCCNQDLKTIYNARYFSEAKRNKET